MTERLQQTTEEFSEEEELEGYYQALQLLNVPNKAEVKILDAASGDGRIILSAQKLGLEKVQFLLLDMAYSAVPDLAKAARARPGKNQLITADMFRSPFKARAVDYTICLTVYELNPPELKLMLLKELARITKTGLVIADSDTDRPVKDWQIKIWPDLGIPQTKKFVSGGKILENLGWYVANSATDKGGTVKLFYPPRERH